MPDVIVIGDGPGGLSASLFLARGGLSVTVFGQDKTAMHWAQINNYLGLDSTHGSAFQEKGRAQATAAGASLVAARVETVATTDDGFSVTLDSGETHTARYLVLSEGKSPRLATSLGLEHSAETGIATDSNGLTAIAGVYAVGRLVRPGRSQAIISAGDGAAAAIDILSREKGGPYCDWDEPPAES